MDCEVCGRRIYGRGRNVIIDGAKLMVCPECAQSATPAPQIYKLRVTVAKKTPSAPKTPRRQAAPLERTAVREDLELVKNYSSLVREARERMRLTHDDLSRKVGVKVSVLQKLETGKMVPDLDMAKKLEYTLKIKLLQPASRVPVEEEFTKRPAGLTLGDVVFVQEKKDGKAEEEPKRGR